MSCLLTVSLTALQSLFKLSSIIWWVKFPHSPILHYAFMDRENNDKNNTFPLGKQICLTIVWGCAEILPSGVPAAASGSCCGLATRSEQSLM